MPVEEIQLGIPQRRAQDQRGHGPNRLAMTGAILQSLRGISRKIRPARLPEALPAKRCKRLCQIA